MKTSNFFLILFLLILGLCQDLTAQRGTRGSRAGNNQIMEDPTRNSTSITDRLFVGGRFGGSISSFNSQGQSYLDLSPILGYRFTDRLAAGLGPVFTYYSLNGNSLTIWGGRVMGRFDILKDVDIDLLDRLFAQAEIQSLVYKDDFGNRQGIRRFPIGGGATHWLQHLFQCYGFIRCALERRWRGQQQPCPL